MVATKGVEPLLLVNRTSALPLDDAAVLLVQLETGIRAPLSSLHPLRITELVRDQGIEPCLDANRASSLHVQSRLNCISDVIGHM